MKQLTVILFSLAFTSNSFGMLTKKFLSYKNIRPFYTNTKTYKIAPDHCPCFAKDCTCGEKKSKNECIALENINFQNHKKELSELSHSTVTDFAKLRGLSIGQPR